MIYCTYELTVSDMRLVLSADACVMFEHANENVSFGTPKCWDDTFLSRINIEEYSIYHVSGVMMRYGNYNRLTDHGGVWRLMDIPKGQFDGAYMTPEGKVYLGISVGYGKDAFLSYIASTIILFPRTYAPDCNCIFQQFKSDSITFTNEDADKSLQALVKTFNGAIALKYSTKNGGSMTVFAEKPAEIFLQSDLTKWPRYNSETVFRKGIL